MKQVGERKANWAKIVSYSEPIKGTNNHSKKIETEFEEDATKSDDFNSGCDSEEKEIQPRKKVK